jgi:hypothetical protein
MDLGRVSGTVVGSSNEVFFVSSLVRNHVFRFGVNYRPDWGEVVGWH